MLLVPWAVGWGVARRWEAKELLLLLAAVGVFTSHAHLMAWRRLALAGRSRTPEAVGSRRLALVFGALGGVAILPLLLRGPGLAPGADALMLLAIVGLALAGGSLALVGRRVLAAIGLPLTGPAAYAVARGTLDRVALAVWLLHAAFFLWAVFYVKLELEARARRRPLGSLAASLRAGTVTLAITLATLLLFAAAVALGPLSPLVLLAFMAPLAQTLAGVARLGRPASLRRLGFLLLAHSLLFGLLVIALA
jgi:hypothetical protein